MLDTIEAELDNIDLELRTLSLQIHGKICAAGLGRMPILIHLLSPPDNPELGFNEQYVPLPHDLFSRQQRIPLALRTIF